MGARSGGLRRLVGVAALALASAVVVGSARPAGAVGFGEQDPTFGAGSGASVPGKVAVLDGQHRILVLGGGDGPGPVVRRYDADGKVDAGFGAAGVATIALDGASSVADLAPAPGAGVVVAGVDPSGVHLWGLDEDGVLDPTFAGDGSVAVTCCGTDGASISRVRVVGVQPDGDVVLVVDQTVSGGNGPTAVLVVDRSGTVTHQAPIDAGFVVPDATVDSAGRVLLLLQARPTSGGVTQLVRTTPDLAADLSFSGDGVASIIGSSQAVAVAADDSVIVAGAASEPGRLELTRFRADGSGDTSFGDQGTVLWGQRSTPFPWLGPMAPFVALAIVPSADQGWTVVSSARGVIGSRPTDGWALTQFRADGSSPNNQLSDTTRVFAAGSPFGSSTDIYASTALPVTDGGGVVVASTTPGQGYALRRYGLMTNLGPTPTLPGGPGSLAATYPTATSAQLSWTAAPVAVGPILWYRVTKQVGSGPVQTETTSSTSWSTSVSRGTAYQITVAAQTQKGEGPTAELVVVPPFTSADRFIAQQFQDFAGRAPTGDEVAAWTAALEAGTAPADLIATLSRSAGWGGIVDPITRLYYAYFQRPPDTSGLAYWAGRLRAGSTLAVVSNTFAASAEFKAKYGSLGNEAFVELVYQNVLGRAGDPAGIAYWTDQLGRKARTRGQVMVQFSESSEHRARRAIEVDVIDLSFAMLRRVPSAADLAAGRPLGAQGRSALARASFDLPEYLARTTS